MSLPSRRLLAVLFFVSGIPALVYQLAWQRALFRVFGGNIESVTIVVTAFILGLGFGSLAGGWLSRRQAPLLVLFAAIEIAIGAFGLVSLRIFDLAAGLTIGHPLVVTAPLALALVIVPTLLMGATLPLLVGYLAARDGNVGSSMGTLYYANTLGASVACMVAALALFPFLGMQGALRVAAAMNFLVAASALGAFALGGRAPQDAPSGRAPQEVPRAPPCRFEFMLCVAALGGMVSLSYEILFVRIASFTTGSSASAFAIVLSAFLVGLASGARRATALCRDADVVRALRSAWISVVSASVLGALFLPALAHLSWLGGGINGALIAIVYLLARLWGVLLPVVAHLGIAPDARAGQRVALLYAANILGASLGTTVTGFVLMDRLTTVELGAVLAAAGGACAVLLASGIMRGARLRAAWLIYGATAVAAVALVPSGAASGLLEALQWKGFAGREGAFAHTVENRNGIITVDAHGVVWGNGAYDGRFNTDLFHDTNGIVRPYALSLFHPAPRQVLMIGLSSGSWAQVLAGNPAIDHLTVVEINPGYLPLIAANSEVASILVNPKVSIVIDDGRRWLRQHPDRRFDAIVQNTTFFYRANTADLLSLEYLALVRRHLAAGGIFYYNTTDSGRAQLTACTAFANGLRFLNHMVVSDAPIEIDFARWRRVLEATRIDGRAVIDEEDAEAAGKLHELMAIGADLRDGGLPSAKKRLETCRELLPRMAALAPITDDNMGSEWRILMGFE